MENLIAYVEKGMTKEDDEGCWIWKGQTNGTGHPIKMYETRVDEKRKAITVNVRKFMYETYRGKPKSRTLFSSCGNKLCCNPDHLIDGMKENRFWVYVDKSGGDDACWLWTGHVVARGYGRITAEDAEGGSETAHRYSYRLSGGTIPEGLSVLHKCNTKRCVNPAHLYVGTHNDNMRDMAESGVMKGTNNPKTLLDENKVREIRKLITGRMMTYAKIAEKYRVKRQTIKDIASSRTWSWLDG